MQKVFGTYGEYYDIFYSDKDYEQECDFVENIFEVYSPKPVRNILDVGCGTGGHSILLARRGYKVTGIDASPVMIKKARGKALKLGIDLNFHRLDIRNFDLKTKYDACVSMFAVIDYLTETHDVLKALKNIKQHLKPNSFFVFDFWNGLAVLHVLPSVRVKVVEADGKRVIRTVHPEMDALNHICKSHYHVLVTQNDTIIDEFKETHEVRYFFPQEMVHYLDDAGFELLKFCPFLNLDGKVDENEWNITAIARARR
ncbi:MAG: class I SAM-dependent methyltransferase [Chloroflexi bacterium]|nr:class I SAM-dependent methyltransferase [Chloroflexota bacterium]